MKIIPLFLSALVGQFLLLACSTGLRTSTPDESFVDTQSGLGAYEKVPESYFNGLPNVRIPLTELKSKGYTLPVCPNGAEIPSSGSHEAPETELNYMILSGL